MMADNEPKRRGRPRKRRGPLVTPSDFNEVILDVGNNMVPQRSANDGLPPITMFERNVRSIGTGAPQNRLASHAFVNLIRSAARELESEKERCARLRRDR